MDNSPSPGGNNGNLVTYLATRLKSTETKDKATCTAVYSREDRRCSTDRVRRLRSMRWQRSDANAVSLSLAILSEYQRSMPSHYGSYQLKSLNSPSSFVRLYSRTFRCGPRHSIHWGATEHRNGMTVRDRTSKLALPGLLFFTGPLIPECTIQASRRPPYPGARASDLITNVVTESCPMIAP